MDSYIAAGRKRELDCVTRQSEERRGDDRMEKKESTVAGTGKYTVIYLHILKLTFALWLLN